MPAWTPGLSWLHYDYRSDTSFVYINIPKNASSWMKENFGGYQYDWHNNQFTQPVNSAITQSRALAAPKQYLVILREPVERWITGFAQYFWGWDIKDPKYYTNQNPSTWVDQVWFDDHTRPQVDFLIGLDHARTTWFECGLKLVDDVKSWMVGKFDHAIRNLDNDPENAYNVSNRGKPWPTNGVTQQQIIDRVKSVLDQNPAYQQRLLDFYRRDIVLRAQVEFYGTR